MKHDMGKIPRTAFLFETFGSVLRYKVYCQTQHLHCCLHCYGEGKEYISKTQWFLVQNFRFCQFLILTSDKLAISFSCQVRRLGLWSWTLLALLLTSHALTFSLGKTLQLIWAQGQKRANFSWVYVNHALPKLSVKLGSFVPCVKLSLYHWSVSALEVYTAVVTTQ